MCGANHIRLTILWQEKETLQPTFQIPKNKWWLFQAIGFWGEWLHNVGTISDQNIKIHLHMWCFTRCEKKLQSYLKAETLLSLSGKNFGLRVLQEASNLGPNMLRQFSHLPTCKQGPPTSTAVLCNVSVMEHLMDKAIWMDEFELKWKDAFPPQDTDFG